MRRRRAWRAQLAAIGVGGLLVLAGCGDDEEPTEEATGGGDATATEAGGEPVATVDVIARDFEFVPPNATVEESGLIAFELENEGGAPHALTIEADPEVESETIEPGQSTSLTGELEPGEYTWYCPVANHRQLGMEGTVTVGGAGAGGGETETETQTETESEDSGAGSSPY